MWSGLGGLANKAGEFLKNLDETLSDDDEQYSGDEQDRQTPITKHELVSDRNYEGQGSSDDLFSKPAAEVPAPAPVPASAPPAAQGQMEKKHQGDEIKKLQGQLDELRTEREDLKSEVANQLKGFTSEMTHSIGSLAAVSGSGSMPPPPTNDDYTSLKLQLQQAEEKLVHMSKAATLHHQELEETISNLQDQVREHRTYGNDKADHANALKKELETVRDDAAHRLEEKAVGEALASQDLRELKDELEAQKDKWWAQNEVLTTTQKALDDYICEASSKDGELERQAEEFRALLAERDHEIRALQEEAQMHEQMRENSGWDDKNTSLQLDEDPLTVEESEGLLATLEARKEELERSQREIETTRRKSVDITCVLEANEREMEELQVKNEELAQQLELSHKELADLSLSQAKVSALEAQLSEQAAAHESSLVALKEQLEARVQEVGAAVAKVAELESSAKIAEQDVLAESEARVEELQLASHTFQARERELEARVEALTAELKSAQDATLQANESASVALREQAARVEALDGELKSAQQSVLDSSEGASEALQKQTLRVYALEGELKTASESAASAQAHVKVLESELKASQEASEKATKSASAAQAKVEALESDLKASQEVHTSVTAAHEEQVTKGKALEDDLRAAQRVAEEAVNAHQESTQRLSHETAQLEERYSTEVMTLRAEADALRKEKVGVETELQSITASFAELEQTATSAEQVNNKRENEMQKELEAAQDESVRLRLELEQIRAASSTSPEASALEELERLGDELAQAQKKAAEEKERGAALASKLKEAERKASTAKEVLTKVRNASSQQEGKLTEQLEAAQTEAEGHAARAEKLVQELEGTKLELESVQRENEQVSSSHSELHEQRGGLEAQVQAMSQQLEHERKQTAEGSHQIDTLSQELEQQRTAALVAESALDEQKDESEKMLTALTQELEAARAALSEQRSEGEQRRKVLSEQLEAAQTEAEGHAARAEKLVQELESLSDRLKHSDESCARLTQDNASLQQSLNDTRSENAFATTRRAAVERKARHGWSVIRQIAGVMTPEDVQEVDGADEEDDEEIDQVASLALQELESLHATKEAHTQDQQIWRDKLEAAESENSSRIIENASLHADLKAVRKALDEAKADLQAATDLCTQGVTRLHDEAESWRARLQEVEAVKTSLEARLDLLQGEHDDLMSRNSACEAAYASAQDELQSQVSAHQQVELFRKQIIAMESDLVQEKSKAAAAEELARTLEEKKKRDLDFLKQQNQKIADIQMEKAEIIDHAEASDALVKQLTAELQGTVPCAKYQEVVSLAEERAEDLKQSKEAHERHMQAMRVQVEESIKASASQVSSRDDLVALKNQYAVDKDKITTEINRLTHALEAEQERRQAAEKEIVRLGSSVQEREDVSETAKSYIATLEGEKARLESELAEAVRTLPATPTFGSSRQRGSTTYANSDRLADLEAGLEQGSVKEDRKADAGLSSPVAKALNFVWALLSKYPAVTRVIGERPPRLSSAGQGLLLYILVLHILIILRIV